MKKPQRMAVELLQLSSYPAISHHVLSTNLACILSCLFGFGNGWDRNVEPVGNTRLALQPALLSNGKWGFAHMGSKTMVSRADEQAVKTPDQLLNEHIEKMTEAMNKDYHGTEMSLSHTL